MTDESGNEREVTIVGVDELDSGDARVSWRSPLARARLKAKVGDLLTVRAPRGPARDHRDSLRRLMRMMCAAVDCTGGLGSISSLSAAVRSRSSACQAPRLIRRR
jgi:hypothetical protein